MWQTKFLRIFFIGISLLLYLLGCIIYVFFREKNTLMFRWFDYCNLSVTIDQIRNMSFLHTTKLPDIILYSFPDGAWVLFGSMLLFFIWDYKFNLYCVFFPVVGIGSEILQYFGFLRGTYDAVDLAFLIVASLIPLYLSYIIRKCYLYQHQNKPKHI
jgi:hypothetical protein